MQETFENPETPGSKPKASPVTIAMGVVVAIAILLSLWFLFAPLQNRKAATVQETVILKMSPAEQEYVNKIEIGNIVMSRAENFLHQEVTTLAGELYNGGNQPILGLTLTTEFSDDMNQIVLRETRRVLGSSGIGPGSGRAPCVRNFLRPRAHFLEHASSRCPRRSCTITSSEKIVY